MADRGIYRVVEKPLLQGLDLALFKLPFQNFNNNSRSKASGFGRSVTGLHEGCEQEAFAMYAGQFTAANETVVSTASFIFDRNTGSKPWQTEMHSLNWLHHFAASKRKLHSHFALRLLGRWAKARHPQDSFETTCKVLLALAIEGAELARGCDHNLQREFLKLASSQADLLRNWSTRSPTQCIQKGATLLTAATAFQGLENLRKPALELLEANIDQVVMADGGHLSGKPEKILDVLALLLPLKLAMELDQQIFPIRTSRAFDRMIAIVEHLRLGGGNLAFVDMSMKRTNLVEKIYAMRTGVRHTHMLAENSQIARLAKGKTCLIADTANRFNFEFSHGIQPLFRSATLGTEQQNNVANTSECAAGLILELGQTSHTRTYFLSSNGLDLRVEDVHAEAIEIVFELQPNVKLTALRESNDLLLVLPGREVWKLSLRGAEARIEQNGLILRLLSTGQGRINWALKKQVKARNTVRRQEHLPDLLS